jgi:hypothetical protein
MRLKTEQQLRTEILEIVKSLKSVRSVKLFLTRCIMETEDLIEQYKAALARDVNARYYLGDFITPGHLRNAETELRIYKNLRENVFPLVENYYNEN